MDLMNIKELPPVCIEGFYDYAERNTKPDIWAYFKHGAVSETTLAENEKAFERFLFLPRMLRDVSKRNLKTNLLRSEIEHPFGISPTAYHKLAHVDGELATAKAAAQTGTPMILSTFSTVELEDVAACYLEHYRGQGIAPLWLQVYVLKDHEIVKDVIKRAESSGFTALVITVDAPFSGLRYETMRHKFTLPKDMNFANFVKYSSLYEDETNSISEMPFKFFDQSLTWISLLTFLKSATSLPILFKGILTVKDAQIAVGYGIDGIFVSNHGGRQLDSVPSALECLVKIAPHIPSTVALYMDCGVRSGADILKALALGAKAVFIGRPVIWGLCYQGSEGVVKIINILRDELDLSLALCGISDVNDVPRDLVVRTTEYYR